MPPSPQTVRELLDSTYRDESRAILAALVRLLGNFDYAEDALHDACAIAADKWPLEGPPENPRAWLISTARFLAIDELRRRDRFDAARQWIAHQSENAWTSPSRETEDNVADDTLRLIFTCCHPALTPEAKIALTLREVCKLTTEEIARACLIPPAALAQRIVRANPKLGIPASRMKCPKKSNCPTV